MNPIRTMWAARAQRGAVLMVMLVIMVIGAATILVGSFSKATLQIERDKKTAEALAQAKEALIGHAIKGSTRPGSLPCPDMDNDGIAEGSCSSSSDVGRLPWKTLGLPDLRDGANERLWYALSLNLRNSGSSINSDTTGQLTVSVTDSTSLDDVAAIVLSAGTLLESQTRNTPAEQITAANYLEGENSNGDTVFLAASSSDTFNDHLLPITTGQIFPLVEKRLAKDVSNCLADYAASNDYGRYPWSTRLNPWQSPDYDDQKDERFGRLPDYMWHTRNDSGDVMPDSWPGTEACNNIFPTTSGWWNNTKWRELIFYSVASKYRPNDYPPSGPCTTTCLRVDPPSPNYDKKIVVVVAGRILAGQNRSSNFDKANPANYLEGSNATADSTKIFEQGSMSDSFNDTVVFQ